MSGKYPELFNFPCVVCGNRAIMAWDIRSEYAACENMDCIETIEAVWSLAKPSNYGTLSVAKDIRRKFLEPEAVT